MCAVVDTCVFFKVFDVHNAEHKNFAPVEKWINGRGGKLIIGGTKYLEELGGHRVFRLFSELKKKQRLVSLSTKTVDDYAKTLKSKVSASAFDDEHIVAMAAISKCCVVCTDDEGAKKYLKQSDLYPANVKRPKIYSGSKGHKALCCSENIAPICK